MFPRLPLCCWMLVAMFLPEAVVLAQPTAVQQDRPMVQLTPDQRETLKRIRNRIVAGGIVQSARTLDVRNQVSGESAIIWLVPEGSRVEPGDLLLKLDDSSLRDALMTQQVEVQQAEAELMEADSRLVMATRLKARLLPVAEKRLAVAKLGQELLLTGDFNPPQEIADAKLKIVEAEEAIVRFGEGHPEYQQLKKILAEKRAFVETYETTVRAYEKAAAELRVMEAEAELEEIQAETRTAEASAAGQIEARKTAYRNARTKLNNIESQIESCRLEASEAGVVLYPTRASNRRAPVIEVGASVREGQVLLQIPDMDQLQVLLKVHESEVERVQVGQEVSLEIGALPGIEIKGQVSGIDSTPQSTSFLDSNTVHYGVTVTLIDPPQNLRIGMSAQAEINMIPKR